MSRWTAEDLPKLAYTLWEADFSDQPFRNWRMAELLLNDPGFHQLLETSGPPDDRCYAPSSSVQEAPDAYNKPLAYKIWELSFSLSHPSHDAFKNWIAALRLW
jgi:hypothetical protein